MPLTPRYHAWPTTRSWLISAMLAWPCLAVAGQSVQPRMIERPSAVLDTGLMKIDAVAELGRGTVLILDTDAPSVLAVDTALTTLRQVGRLGPGPREYRRPARLLFWPGDSVAILDGADSQLLGVGPDGGIAAKRQGRWHRACSNAVASTLGIPRAVDGTGRLYAQAEPVQRTRNGQLRPVDSAAVERWSYSCHRDTLAMVPSPYGRDGIIMSGLVIGRPGQPTDPFPKRVLWVVDSAGRLAIVYPDPYHVEFVLPDKRRHRGAPIEYTPIRVTEAIKGNWREEHLGPITAMATGRDGRRVQVTAPSPYTEPDEWPRALPPYLDDAALMAPDGRLWIARTVALGEAPLYDVIDTEGRLVEQWRLPPDRRLVGVGHNVLYLARRDSNEFEYLERYAIPPR